MHRTSRFFAILAAVLGLWSPLAHTAQYTYDQRGRLTSVTESDGSTSTYSYDANGNILSITRTSATLPLALSTFSPSTGPVGTSVTIRGTGFNPVAGQNAVSFGGQAATVTSSNATTIVAVVPAQASTGLISVSVGGNTATSAAPFTVTTIQIRDFAPKIGAAGTQVIIDGDGFDQSPANNVVKFNTEVATVSAASTTQLTAVVPASATSGRISVTAPAGAAASDADFVVPPPGYTAANVASVGRLTKPGPGVVLTANTTNKVAMALFDGSIGERLTLVFTNVSMSGTWYVYAPDGSRLTWGNLGSSNMTLDLGPLQAAGTYTVALRPTTSSGSATIRVVSDALGSILTDGTPLPMSLAAGQNAMLSFNAVAGESYNFVLTNYASTPIFAGSAVYILNPDGTQMKYCGGLSGGSDACFFTTPTTGTYRIRLNETGLNAASYEARLNIDFRVLLVPGSPIEMQLDKVGRNALLQFSVATGQSVTLNLSNIVTTPSGERVVVSIYNSIGSEVASNWGYESLTLNFKTLPAGNYTARVVVRNAAMANFRIGFVALQPTPLASNGTTELFSAQLADQDGYFTFTGSQGQKLSLGITGVSYQSGASGNVSIYVEGPDGPQLAAITCNTDVGRCQLPFPTLPLSGTYRIHLAPYGHDKLTAFVTLSQTVFATLTPDVPITIDLASPGQNAWLSFSVATQQSLVVKVGSMNLTPAGSSVTVRVYNAAFSQVATVTSSTTASLALPNLAAGNYKVTIDPTTAGTGSLQATLTQGVPITTDGTAVNFAATSLGEAGYFTFSAVAGQNIGVGLTNLTLAPNSPSTVTVRVYRPDGAQVTSQTCSISNTGCALVLRNLPATGTYRIEVQPGASQSIGFTIQVSHATGGAVSLTTTPISASFDVPGRFARYTFDAAAGGVAAVRLGPTSMSPANGAVVVSVYNPSGAQVGTATVTTTPATLNVVNLVAGTYTVTATPTLAATGTAELTLAPGLTGILPSDGSSTSRSGTVPGQFGYFTFSGTTGQNLGLAGTGMSLVPTSPSSNTITLRVYKPDNSLLTSVNCRTSNFGCPLTLSSLPATGTYRVQLEPGSQQTVAFTLTLSQSVTGTLASGTPLPFTLSSPGQYAAVTFAATAGQSVPLTLAAPVMTPASSQVTVRVYNSSGTQISTGTATTGPLTLTMNSLAAGTYTVFVVPTYGATGNLQLSRP
jgi:YD repeat-containing protein